jgi:hypothetical protein
MAHWRRRFSAALIICGFLSGSQEPTYLLILDTAAGKRVALSAADRGYVEFLHDALGQALSAAERTHGLDVFGFDDQLDDFWRDGFLSGGKNPKMLQAKYAALINSFQAQAAHLPKDEQDRLFMRVAMRNAEYISLAQQDVETLKRQIGASVSPTSTNRLAQIAAETAVRAVVWKSVAAIFRAFR